MKREYIRHFFVLWKLNSLVFLGWFIFVDFKFVISGWVVKHHAQSNREICLIKISHEINFQAYKLVKYNMFWDISKRSWKKVDPAFLKIEMH